MSLYGNDICLLDATYKTTKYVLPLFFLVVKTNVSFEVVGSFVTQSETTAAITEGFKIISEDPDRISSIHSLLLITGDGLLIF